MFRLIGPYIFVIAGIFVGIVTTRLFNNPLRFGVNIIVGILGSFFGLWVRDILDVTMGGNLSGALGAAMIGALVSTVALNLLMNRQDKGDS